MPNNKKGYIPKISVVIITKNEENNIVPCLETVMWADEIVIVDSLSTDRTVELAKKYTNRIFLKPFSNYADQKNYATQKASYEWILNIDADERITDELRVEILKNITQTGVYAFWIPCLDYMFGRPILHGGWYPQQHLRLFNKEYCQWTKSVHETLDVDGKIGSLKNPILHFSHHTMSHFILKLDHYTTMEAESMVRIKRPIRPLALFVMPLIVFLYKYIYQLGFLDGRHGLFLAVSLSYYHFVKYSKFIELSKNKKV